MHLLTRVARVVPAVVVLWISCPAIATAGAQFYGGRIQIRAVDPQTGNVIPTARARIADEERLLLASSGRELISMRPVQVGAGGRLFVSTEVPAELQLIDLDVEIMLREKGQWVRRRTFTRRAGTAGQIAATLVVPDLEPGPVVAAVYAQRRTAISALQSAPLVIPRNARLRVGFALDEQVWSKLSPVTVRVHAVAVDEGQATARYSLFEQRIDPGREPAKWVDVDADLGFLSGREVRLEFRAEPEFEEGKIPSMVAWSVPKVVFVDKGRPQSSIVLVSVDSLRASSLGCMGSGRDTSPFLDSLFGKQGVIFERAVTQSVTSLPAHMTLLTSLYPSVHGVTGRTRALSNKVATLPAVMRKQGYATAAFTGGGPLAAEFGFGYGFDAYYEDRDPNVGNPDGTASRPFDHAIEWFSRHADEPVFLFIHVDQVRSPYVPPTGYQDLFDDERLNRPSRIDEGALVRYDREIRFVNDVFEAFVARLDKLSSPKRTLLVLTSGNGQEFLEHGARFSGTHLYEESIRVPLMMRGLDLRAGQRYSDPVGIIDVMPTLLELAGLQSPGNLQGVSFGRWLRSGLPVELPPRFCEARGSSRVGKDGQDKPWKGPAYAVVEGEHKVIVSKSAPQVEAYDLTSDPAETTSLAGSAGSPSWVARLTDVVRNYPTACKQVAKPVATPFLTPETRAKLRALGYAD